MSTPLKSQPIPPSNNSFHSHQGQHRTVRPVEHFSSTNVRPFAQSMAMPSVPNCSDTPLDLSKLGNFEIVKNQYKKQGIQFRNAIALHPSNPAFPPYSGNAIILGGPKNGIIDIVCSPPVHTVEAYVTSSGVTIMTAFNDKGDVIGTDETLGRNLADEQSPYPPHARLAVPASGNQNIHHIRLRCSGGQLSLSNLSFSRIGG